MSTASNTDVLIDWPDTGNYIEAGTDVSTRVRRKPGLKMVRGRDSAKSTSPAMAGSISFTLDNQSRDYSPGNTSSPLYGKVHSGHEVRVRGFAGTRGAYDETAPYDETKPYDGSSSQYELQRAYLDNPKQIPSRTDKATQVVALGPLSRLAGVKVSTALYAGITTGAAIGYLLDAVGWPTSKRRVDAGLTTLVYWWLNNEDAFAAFKALVYTEGPGASGYEDANGYIVFENRYYRQQTTRSISSQATLRDSGSEPLHSAPGNYDDGALNVVNSVVIPTNVRTPKSTTAVWKAAADIALGVNEIRNIPISASDPFQDALAPVYVWDYALISGSVASAVLNRTSGQNATLTLTAGPGGASLAGLQVRANPVTVDSSPLVQNSIDMSASIGRHGVQTFPFTIRPDIDPNVALDFANIWVSWYGEGRPTDTITIKSDLAGTLGSRATEIFGAEISDRITIYDAQNDLAGADFWINRKAVATDGKYLEGALDCESVTISTTYLMFDSGTFDGPAVMGY